MSLESDRFARESLQSCRVSSLQLVLILLISLSTVSNSLKNEAERRRRDQSQIDHLKSTNQPLRSLRKTKTGPELETSPYSPPSCVGRGSSAALEAP